MEGIKLNKVEFCILNDNDAFFLFQKEIQEFLQTLTPEQTILSGADSYVEFLNEQLFKVYHHIFITPQNSILGWDGFSYNLIADSISDVYISAIELNPRPIQHR